VFKRVILHRLVLVRGAEIALFVVLGALPLVEHSPYALGLLTLLAIYGVVLIGLDITVGYLGQVNLAQAAMLGLGAYVAGIAATRYGVGIPLAVLLSGGFCTAIGAVSPSWSARRLVFSVAHRSLRDVTISLTA